MFWRLTPRELEALLDAIGERREQENEAENLRAGLVAAMIYNVHRRRGAKPKEPRDFFRPAKAGDEIVSTEQMRSALDAWADRTNRRAERRRR
ncbi:MAG TPA: hypothetical protein VK966_01335 [Longimicrobiales bacterium]|nr:hypothetical protein [Longimicrobiales bacterium]